MFDSSFYSNILDSLQNFDVDYCFNKEQLNQITERAKAEGISFAYHIVYSERKEIEIIELVPIELRKNGKKEKRNPNLFVSFELLPNTPVDKNITFRYKKITSEVKEQLSQELVNYINYSYKVSQANKPRRNLRSLQIKKMKDECDLLHKADVKNCSIKMDRKFSFSCSFLEEVNTK